MFDSVTVDDWDSMGHVITQTRGLAFQPFARAFSFLLVECFKSSDEPFKSLAACFETNAQPGL